MSCSSASSATATVTDGVVPPVRLLVPRLSGDAIRAERADHTTRYGPPAEPYTVTGAASPDVAATVVIAACTVAGVALYAIATVAVPW